MRLGICVGFSVVCMTGAFGCKSESEPPVYLDTAYQLRCRDCVPSTSDDPRHEVQLLDGEFEWKISCSVTRISGKRSLNLNAIYDTPRESQRYGLRITRANVDSSSQSGECKVRVTEGDNTYEGACTGDDPSEEAPCKVSFKNKSGIVTGNIYCQKIRRTPVTDIATFRYLVDPGSFDTAAKLEIHNCSGL